MNEIRCILILIGLALLIIAVYLKFTIIPNKKNRAKRKNRYYNHKNYYFKNNPEHVDMTSDYINKLWEKNK